MDGVSLVSTMRGFGISSSQRSSLPSGVQGAWFPASHNLNGPGCCPG